MAGQRAKVFWSGRSQAVRLPKEFRFETDTVLVRRKGKGLLIEPADEWPEGFFEALAGEPTDLERPPQGKPEKREKIR